MSSSSQPDPDFVTTPGGTPSRREAVFRLPPLRRDERQYYAAFAEFVGRIEQLDRCVPLGGGSLGQHWGTPDVVGLRYGEAGPVRSDPVLLAGELKVTRYQLMHAFGQAVAYKLFAHLSYLAVPRQAGAPQMRRLEQLCLRQQVGFVSFDEDHPDDPRFELHVRPTPAAPDPAALNDKLSRLQGLLSD